ncbi:hypothetical protein L208DRAFT_159468 [Tricholoma matsutake]|nr:hypothetical protein L208DRAFT_159468 [Tricholoma matsutake 945]
MTSVVSMSGVANWAQRAATLSPSAKLLALARLGVKLGTKAMGGPSLEGISANVRLQPTSPRNSKNLGGYKGERQGTQPGGYGAYDKTETADVPRHEPSMMEKIKGEAERMTGRKGRAEQDTEGEYGRDGYGEGEYGQSGTREQHGQSTRGEYGQSAVEPSEHQPSMMDKIKGGAEKLSGKITRDPGRVQAGKARQEGMYEEGKGY